MSESELATLDSINSDQQSHIIMSDCDCESDNGIDGPFFLPNKPKAATLCGTTQDVIDDKLEIAICNNNMDEVQQLIKNDSTLLQSNALHCAVKNNLWEMTKLLLSLHSDVNLKIEPQNATPLLWACSKGNAYLVKLLLEYNADLDVVDSSMFTPLHLAVHSSNILMVVYLLHLNVEVDKIDGEARTPLHWACVQGDFLSVEALLKAGASPNLPDGEGTYPLYLAVYTSKSVTIVKLLLQFGADPSKVIQQTPEIMMNPVWEEGCFEAGRSSTGNLFSRTSTVSPELAKALTTVAPLVTIPSALGTFYLLPEYIWYMGIFTFLSVIYLAKIILTKYIIPCAWFGKNAVLQSTLLAGIFAGLLFWDVYYYLVCVFPVVLSVQPVLTFFVLCGIFLLVFSYCVTCFVDPGKIEPKPIKDRLRAMNDLMDLGRFDSVHLCTHTYVQRPFRSRYDQYLNRVVCRYDHYCPWMYNVIGLRNHRPFIIFLLTVDFLLVAAGFQYITFKRLTGVKSYFGDGLSIITGLQSVWLIVLTLVQFAQISRGVTTTELSSQDGLDVFRTDPIRAYSSLPKDHPMAEEIFEGSEALNSLKRHGCTNHKYPTWMRITGISQFIMILKGSKSNEVANSSFSRNCTDFWCTGENLWHPRGGTGKIGGIKVDYYTLIDAQMRPRSESDRMLV